MKDLQNNFSIEQLDDIKDKIYMEGEILKLVRESILIMKADKIKTNLYVFKRYVARNRHNICINKLIRSYDDVAL